MTTCFNTLELNDNRRLVDALLNINPKADPKEFLAILNAQDNLDILEVAAGFASLSKGIRNINMAVSHASKVVTSLKSYSRQDEHDVFAQMSIVDSLEAILTLHHQHIKQGVEVIRKYDKTPLILGCC